MELDGRLDAAATGDGVAFSFAVENAGGEPVELQFRDARRAEFEVLDGEETVWRFGEDRAFAQALATETLRPGETLTVECEWERPSTGTFVAVATLSATDVECAARTRVTV